MPIALLSVYDKTGIVDFAKELVALEWDLVSTGGTARTLTQAGLRVRDIEALTKFPEMLDGRVKTLHPAVHGGLLARRDLPEHMSAIAEHGIERIDLVAVNLYPFRETAARAGATFGDVVEQIEIGAPSMLRSGAKNHASVWTIVDPEDYARVLATLRDGSRDGRLCVVSRDGTRFSRADGVARSMQEALDGTHVTWMEKVSDEQYGGTTG